MDGWSLSCFSYLQFLHVLRFGALLRSILYWCRLLFSFPWELIRLSFVGIFCYVTKKFYQTSVHCWFWISWLSLHAYGDTWNKICFEWVNTLIKTVNKWVHLQLRWDNRYGDGYILNGVKWLSKPLVIRIEDVSVEISAPCMLACLYERWWWVTDPCN